MAIVDEQGRLFGRVNLFDAVIVLVLLGLVPLGYAAYVLFRTPPPRLTAVEPTTIPFGPNLRVTLRGEYLCLYMRASFGDCQGMNFLFNSTTSAEVDLPDMVPGVYDVVLYDYAQERARLPKALTITPPPAAATFVEVIGAFRSLATSAVGKLATGVELPSIGTIVRLGGPTPSVTRARSGTGTIEIPVEALVDVPAILRVSCHVQMIDNEAHCAAGTTRLEPDTFLTLDSPIGRVAFQIDQVRAETPLEPVEVNARFVGDPEALALLKPDDVDVGVSRNELVSGARVMAAGPVRRLGASVAVTSESRIVAGDVSVRDVTLRVPAQKGATGWRYGGSELRVGGAFSLHTAAYEIHGSVVRLTPQGAGSSK